MLSPRVAPPMIGVGLLEDIHPGDILARADPDDADGDGISGKASMVRDPETGELMLGRFGWKASTPTIKVADRRRLLRRHRHFHAARDAGLRRVHGRRRRSAATRRAASRRGSARSRRPTRSSTSSPSTAATSACRRAATSTTREVLPGKALFYDFGCASCHTPKYVTSRDAPQPEHRFQLIWPYTDLLLHDMGDGLADGRPVGDASGSEWRTAPLWGIGLTETVSGHTFFLHDGRARNLLEAVLWHGGEAEAARDAVVAATPDERDALIRFLESL